MSMEQTNQWKGYTLEELRMKRAKALIMTEVSKSQLLSAYEMAKSKTSSHGVRAHCYSTTTCWRGWKTTDYLILGAKTTMLGYKLWKKFKKIAHYSFFYSFFNLTTTFSRKMQIFKLFDIYLHCNHQLNKHSQFKIKRLSTNIYLFNNKID